MQHDTIPTLLFTKLGSVTFISTSCSPCVFLLFFAQIGDGNMTSDNLYISGLPSPAVDEDVLQGLFTGVGFTIVRSRCVG